MSQLTAPGQVRAALGKALPEAVDPLALPDSDCIVLLRQIDPTELDQHNASEVLDTIQAAADHRSEKQREKEGGNQWGERVADIQSSLNGLFGSMLSPGHAAEARQFLAELQMRAGTDSEFERDPQSPTQNEPALEDRLMKLCAEIAQLPAEKQEELRLAARDGAERLRSGWTTPIELQFPLVRDVSVRSEPGTLGEIENLSLAVAPGGLLTLQRGTQVAAQGNMLALLDPTALVVDNGEFRFSQDARPNSPTGFSGVSFRCTFPAGSTFAIAA